MKQKPTYTEAMQRLEQITRAIEQGELDIDSLSDNIKETQSLLAFCKDKLQKVEKDVNALLNPNEQE